MKDNDPYLETVYYVVNGEGFRYQISMVDDWIELQYQERFIETWKPIDIFRIDPACVPLIIASILELTKKRTEVQTHNTTRRKQNQRVHQIYSHARKMRN